ncbi:MAG: glutamine--tRNA ligase/YqeY domain fusion protein [Gammaproteobacteria bacterium]|jgi:glutaminyl-tRNA synthetase|nr:MAG: glutamine--tRNA ligase/YqeY domain fusion protein [Gammaproteobacteria bacterium]
MSESETKRPVDFIRRIIDEDLREGRHDHVHTRFPPEPNGYLHIGHAKSICLNFGIARDYGGKCNLRFDDTNPEKENTEYVEAIKRDVRWLGFDWEDREYYASDYFPQLYEYALDLIRQGKAYVDSLSADEIRERRGTLTEPGLPSPYRDRPVEENLDLFQRMKAGEFADGEHVLRAKIDMASPNVNLRDPAIYRIRKASHHRTGDAWKIYPLYDYTHCLSDAIEHITHSICTLEFEDHRPLYDWVLDNLATPSRPHQYEFARLVVDYAILSKRRLILLVSQGHVRGWDDPRMPTLAGIRRRGYTPESIRDFCERIGVTKNDTRIDMALLDNCLREDLDRRAPRAMMVLDPLKVVIENYPEDRDEDLPAPNHPTDPAMSSRVIPFGRVIYIERDDFMEDPPAKFHRLAPGREVRLRYAYFITCREVVKDPSTGAVVELRCTYDPATKGGNAPDGRKVKGTIHWVPGGQAIAAEIRLYDRLFTAPNPDGVEGDWLTLLNPDSERIVKTAFIEPSLKQAEPEARYQFERLGYFVADRHDWDPTRPVFNRIVTLRDSWAKVKNTQTENQ